MEKLFIILSIVGCIGFSGKDQELVRLIDNTQWTLTSFTADDPFTEMQPTAFECEPGNYGTEFYGDDVWFSIQTDKCNYITISQPLLKDVRQGDYITINIFHFSLTAPANSQANLALAVGNEVVWQTAIPIPSNSGAVLEAFQATSDYAAGTPVIFHIDNHGQNSYHLIDIVLGDYSR